VRTPQGEGQEGVREATPSELGGREVESRVVGENATYHNPGATPNLRGVEANTAMTNGFECDAPKGTAAGTRGSSELDIGASGFANPEAQAQEPGAHPELMTEGRM
jgi:hypothetical protein